MKTYKKGKQDIFFMGSLCKAMFCKPGPKGKTTPFRGVLHKRAFTFQMINILFHLCLYSYLEGPLFLQYGENDEEDAKNFFEQNGVDSKFFLFVALSMRILLVLPFIFWPASAKSYFYLEGVYFLVLALIPMQLSIFRNLVTFVVMLLWLAVFYTDFVLNIIWLNLVSIMTYFLIYPYMYSNSDADQFMLKICFVVLLNLTIFCMELTCVYIESVGESYEKQKGESLMIFDKSKQGLMLKQHKQGGSIYFVNSRLQELVEKC